MANCLIEFDEHGDKLIHHADHCDCDDENLNKLADLQRRYDALGLQLAEEVAETNALVIERDALRDSHGELLAASRDLAETLETCHICKGSIVIQDWPVHCDDCSVHCENHEGPECKPIYVLHNSLKAAIKKAELL